MASEKLSPRLDTTCISFRRTADDGCHCEYESVLEQLRQEGIYLEDTFGRIVQGKLRFCRDDAFLSRYSKSTHS